MTHTDNKSLVEEANKWIKSEPSDNYEGLLKQFRAMKQLLNSQAKISSFYRKAYDENSQDNLNRLQGLLESEKAMNAQLTEELAALQNQQPTDTNSPTLYNSKGGNDTNVNQQMLEALKVARGALACREHNAANIVNQAIAAAESALQSQNKDSILYLDTRDEIIAKLKEGLWFYKDSSKYDVSVKTTGGDVVIGAASHSICYDRGETASRTLAEVEEMEEGS